MSIMTRVSERPKPRAAAALLGSTRTWLSMARRGTLQAPKGLRGARLRFADGTESFVFRETIAKDVDLSEPCVLIVAFKLRLLRRASLPHALFRIACVVNTPLFSGFPGFATKLWLADTTTGVYRGVYDWNGADAARDYAEALCVLLRIGSVPGSVRYRVLPRVRRTEYLHDGHATGGDDTWWRLRQPMLPPPGAAPDLDRG
jgi:hypothetical protein